jgi:hypothetical protein
MVNIKVGGCAVVIGLAGCNVSSAPPNTGGFEGSAVAVVCSDFKSTNVAIARPDGTMVSGSFVSTGSAKPGLALALSGDVTVPFVSPASGRVVTIDRFGTDVLTWMSAVKGSVIAQLALGTGFDSNPHDYIEVDSKRAYVTRYGTNPAPGQKPFDGGGDLLILDTTAFAITGRIALPEENPALQPSPDGMNWLGREVVVTLGRVSADFTQIGDGRFVGVSPTTNAIDWTVDVTGLQTCGRLVVSPAGNLAAIACSSTGDATTGKFDPTKSDIVLYDATQMPPKELRRLGLGPKLNSGVQPTIAFAADDTILALTYGGNATPGDTVFAVKASTGDVTALGQATKPFTLGGMRCSPGAGDVCLLSDADRNVVRRWKVASSGLSPLASVNVDPTVGLPPRDMGGVQ